MFDFDGIELTGPEDYLATRGYLLLDAILAEEDEEANAMLREGHEEEAILARLQQDYEVWLRAQS